MAAWGWRRGQGAAPEQPLVRFPLSADPSLRIQTGFTTPFAVSPDGRTIVFLAVSGDTKPHLWARTLDDPRPRRLEDTEKGGQPAISPDGEWVAFVAQDNQIKKVRLSGGPATHLATIESWSAALAWTSNDEIVFEIWGKGIHRVSAHGGAPELLIPLDTAAHETRQRRPFVLRRERAIVYASMTEDRVELVLFSLASGRRARLGVDGVQALGMIDGHLVFARADGTLMAAPFDVGGMRLTGAVRPLRDRVASSGVGTAVALSERGTLVYRSAEAAALRLLLVDAQGRVQPLGPEARAFEGPRFSPDGRRVVVAIDSRAGMAAGRGETDLWMIDRQSGEATRLTRTGKAANPVWAPDGKRVVYIAGTPQAPREVWTLPIDGSAEPRRLVEIEGDVAQAVLAPDGRSLVAVRRGPGSGTEELIRVALDGTASAAPLVAASLPSAPRARPTPDLPRRAMGGVPGHGDPGALRARPRWSGRPAGDGWRRLRHAGLGTGQPTSLLLHGTWLGGRGAPDGAQPGGGGASQRGRVRLSHR